MIAPKLAKLLILKMRQGLAVYHQGNKRRQGKLHETQTDAAIDEDGPALKQHCNNVSRRPYSQSRALQCLRVYTWR